MTDLNKFYHTQVDVLRHGSCEGGEIFRGSTDVSLNEQGWQQMQQSVTHGDWDQIVTSPLRRCREFAHWFGQEKGLDVEVDDRWREYSFGDWEGVPREEIWQKYSSDVLAFFADPASYTPKNGEPFEQIMHRVQEAWNDLVQKHQSKRVLLVTHGGIFRTLYLQIMDLPSSSFNSLEAPYACLSRWKHFHDDRRSQTTLSFHNARLDFHSQPDGK